MVAMSHALASPLGTRCRPQRQAQHGLALITVLLFLLAITGVVVWSARQSMMGEGAARNKLDIEVAREAAEAALRDAERDINNYKTARLDNAACARGVKVDPALFGADCAGGLCKRADADYAASDWSAATKGSTVFSEPWWPPEKGGLWNNDFDKKPKRAADGGASGDCALLYGGVPLGVFTGVSPIRGVARQPEYIIEHFDRNSPISYQATPTYRITARGFGYLTRTQVVLQSYFVPLK